MRTMRAARRFGTAARRVTAADRSTAHPGYWPSAWPVECGGNRRQKASAGSLDAASGVASVTSRRDKQWHVMVIKRDEGEWFLGGTMAAFSGPPPHGWVERIDPATLEPLAASPQLPCGEHVWCGALLAHANGSIYNVNGSYLHRLDPTSCEVVSERQLPANRSHNGLLALSDGSLITKDLRLEGQGGTTVSRLDPETLAVSESLVLPEGSMGRIAADVVDGVDEVYLPGTERFWRLRVTAERMVLDESWSPRYREAGGEQGLAWDSCVADGCCYVLDNGDVLSVRAIHAREPNGRWDSHPGSALSWRQPAPWSGAQRLLRVNLSTGRVDAIAPFGRAGGGIIAPPVAVPELGVAVVWDSINGGLAGVDIGGDELAVRWVAKGVNGRPLRPSMQPVVFPESGEFVINDFSDGESDHLIVVDLQSGELLDRVDLRSPVANGMFLTPGGERDVFYCSTLTVARVQWS